MENRNDTNRARRIAARVAKASKRTAKTIGRGTVKVAKVGGEQARKTVYAIGIILTVPGTLIAYAARKRGDKSPA